MMLLSGRELCSAVKGQLYIEGQRAVDSLLNQKIPFQGVSIDSRDSHLKDRIFFAIQGPKWDGHDFLLPAIQKEVKGVVVRQGFRKELLRKIPSSAVPRSVWSSLLIIEVDDTLQALQKLAVYWRKKIQLKVIGITGSAGKTTTKHFCLQLLDKHFLVQGSVKSFNNQYGVPLSLLSARKGLDFFVQEIGMNKKGEMAFLCDIAEPHISAVVQVGTSHIGLLGDQKAIAYEKEQIYWHSSPKGVFVFNYDDPYVRNMYDRIKHSQLGFKKLVCFSSRDSACDVFLQIQQVEQAHLVVKGHCNGVSGTARVPVTGSVHLTNLMAAMALAVSAGLPASQVWERLKFCSLPPLRSQWVRLASGAKALFDAYNASPESVLALLDHFLSPVVKGKKIVILGDFLELGDYLERLQKQIAKKLCQATDLHTCWLIGDQAEKLGELLKKQALLSKTHVFISKQVNLELAKKNLSMLDHSFVMAFKASRKMQLEKVLVHFQPLDFHAL